MKQNMSIFYIFLLILIIPVCSPDQEPDISIVPLNLNDGWQISTPQAQGFNIKKLKIAYEKAFTYPFMYSTLIIRNGYLVAEKYFNGADVYQARYIASATKSYMSALIGIAIENGIVKIKELVVDRFTTKTARVEKIEMVDAVTGDIYCTWIERGEMKKVKAECNRIEYLNGQMIISGISSIYGCSDSEALNYNSNVNVDD